MPARFDLSQTFFFFEHSRCSEISEQICRPAAIKREASHRSKQYRGGQSVEQSRALEQAGGNHSRQLVCASRTAKTASRKRPWTQRSPVHIFAARTMPCINNCGQICRLRILHCM